MRMAEGYDKTCPESLENACRILSDIPYKFTHPNAWFQLGTCFLQLSERNSDRAYECFKRGLGWKSYFPSELELFIPCTAIMSCLRQDRQPLCDPFLIPTVLSNNSPCNTPEPTFESITAQGVRSARYHAVNSNQLGSVLQSQCLQFAAHNGNGDAAYRLHKGNMYSPSRKWVYLLLALSKQHPKAYFEFARECADGTAFPINLSLAQHYADRALEAKCTHALVHYGAQKIRELQYEAGYTMIREALNKACSRAIKFMAKRYHWGDPYLPCDDRMTWILDIINSGGLRQRFKPLVSDTVGCVL